jgi:hypothetical protein
VIFLPLLYKDKAHTVAVCLFSTPMRYPFLVSTYIYYVLCIIVYYQDRINSDYNIMCFNSILIHIDMDVSEERAALLNLREVGPS